MHHSFIHSFTYPGQGLRITWETAGLKEGTKSNWLKGLKRISVYGLKDHWEIPRGDEAQPLRINLRMPPRNLITRSCFLIDLQSTVLWFAAIVAMYTLSVDTDRDLSRPSWSKDSIDPMPHLWGLFPWEEHQFMKMHEGAQACIIAV